MWNANWLKSTPMGAYAAAGAQLVVIVIAAVAGAGAPPVEGESVVTLTNGQAWWIGVLWFVSLLGMWQAYASLYRQRHAAETEMDSARAERDAVRAELDKKRANQVLSDLMSDQWEVGIHELLNRAPSDGEESLNEWRAAVRRWQQKTLEMMAAHNCTKQDMQSVRVIGLAPMIPTLHRELPACHAMSMLAAQLNRVADIARKYGD
jgi:hypothetical protein